ncbi:MAG TPA: septum site-determining protein MinC [Caldilineaceae bacterium]|nr:septum site-determining protein MinC [Caldilineaceae bacterium]
MSFFGKPPAGQPKKAFNLSQQNGEQVDAVRSKIASLMEGATEQRPPQANQLPKDVQDTSAPPPPAPESSQAAHDADSDVRFAHPDSNQSPEQQDWSDTEDWPRRSQWQAAPSDANSRSLNEQYASDQAAQSSWPRPSTNRTPATTERSTAGPPAVTASSGSVNAEMGQNAMNNRPFVTEEPKRAEQADVTLHIPSDSQEASSGNAPVSAINIKGRAGGILIEIGHGSWPQLMNSLTERLAGAGNFFRNGVVTLDLESRPLTESELHQLHTLLTDQALELVLVRTASEETFQVALDLGLSAQLETMAGDATVSAQPAQTNLRNEPHFVYAGHLRAGQVLQRSEHILVIGDVNPGSTVISNGDILVWGHLRGLAHAGAGGDTRALIAALHLSAVQLRIGDYVAIAPEPTPKRRWGRPQPAPAKQAEVAYINGDRIVVEPWDATKFGGIAALRQ